jgi:hypothetical protein
MALSPRFTINFECNFDGFTFEETTGAYNVSTNTIGYGSPNITTSDVDSTELIIENLLTEITFDTISTISASSGSTEYEFDLTDLTVDGVEQYDTYMLDGIYEFTYNVIDGSTTYTYTIRKLILPYLYGLLAKAALKLGTCTCSSKFKDSWLQGFAFLKALEGTAICGDITQFVEQYTKVKNYLINLKCNC